MAVRVTYDDVTDVIETSLTEPQVVAFITDASLWVDNNLASDSLSTATLTAIEKYLACHFVTLRDPRLKSGTIEDVAEVYQRDLYVSEYLKAAAALDPTGKVREHFMTPKNVRRMVARTGTGFDT